MVLFLCLKPDGEVKEVDKTLNPKFQLDETLSLQYLKGVIENKGKGKIERLYVWNFQYNQIYIYGWKKGSHEQINNHSLPKPLNEDTFYGDLVCFLVCNDQMIDFTEGFYLDFFQNDWEEADDDEMECDEEEIVEIEELEEDDDDEELAEPVIIHEIQYQYSDELSMEPEYVGM